MALSIDAQGKLLLSFKDEIIGSILSDNAEKNKNKFLDGYISDVVKKELAVEKLDNLFIRISKEESDDEFKNIVAELYPLDLPASQNSNTSWGDWIIRFRGVSGAALNFWSIFIDEAIDVFLLLQSNNSPETPPNKLTSEVLSSIYAQKVDLLPDETIKNFKILDEIFVTNFATFKSIENTNIRLIFLIVNFISKKLDFNTDDFNSQEFSNLIGSDNLNISNLVQSLSSNDIFYETGHTKLFNALLKFLFPQDRFNEDGQSTVKEKLREEYFSYIHLTHQYFSSYHLNPIDYILNLLNSKILSAFLVESLIANLGLTSSEDTDNEPQTEEQQEGSSDRFRTQEDFNKNLKRLSVEVSNSIIETERSAPELWKLQLVRIVKEFSRRPNGLPNQARKYLDEIQDDENITSFSFINKLAGLYCCIELSKKTPVDDKFIFIYSLLTLSYSFIEVDNEINRHNQILSNQLKSLIFGLGSVVIILSTSVLLAYKSWLIFGLMLLSTALTVCISIGWFYLIESTSLNPKTNFINSIEEKYKIYKYIGNMVDEKVEFIDFTRKLVNNIQTLVNDLKEHLDFLGVRMPNVLASTLMGVSYGISLSIPIWAYCLNAFQPYCMIPSLLIALVATICHNWANMPIEHKSSGLVEVNGQTQATAISMFEEKMPLLRQPSIEPANIHG